MLHFLKAGAFALSITAPADDLIRVQAPTLDEANPIILQFQDSLRGCLTDGVPTVYSPKVYIVPPTDMSQAERSKLQSDALGLFKNTWDRVVNETDSATMLGEALRRDNIILREFANNALKQGLVESGQLALPSVTAGPTIIFGQACEAVEPPREEPTSPNNNGSRGKGYEPPAQGPLAPGV